MLEKQEIKVNEWGEIISAEVTTIKKVSAEQFMQVYLQDNEEFYKLSKAESNILSVCWLMSTYYNDRELDYPGNKVVYNSELRDRIIIKTGLKESTIKNGMSSLTKKEMLIKDPDHRGIYYLNPKYFFKGKLSDRTKVIKHLTEYQLNKDETNTETSK